MSMTVSVGFIGPWGKGKTAITCGPGATVKDALIGFQESEIKSDHLDILRKILDQEPENFIKSNIVLLNGKYLDISKGGLGMELHDGDEIVLIPPFEAG
ncbi:MAG TPA: hypothetical protein GX506_04435 [Firmicutes bacterium]|nr:hypothetical protein [Bacillota bacterium]